MPLDITLEYYGGNVDFMRAFSGRSSGTRHLYSERFADPVTQGVSIFVVDGSAFKRFSFFSNRFDLRLSPRKRVVHVFGTPSLQLPTLPVEILEEIFWHVFYGSGNLMYDHRPALVCRAWLSIALSFLHFNLDRASPRSLAENVLHGRSCSLRIRRLCLSCLLQLEHVHCSSPRAHYDCALRSRPRYGLRQSRGFYGRAF